MTFLHTPLNLRLPARTAKKFHDAGIETIGDLLFYAPRRYYHWGRLTPMSALHEGEDVTLLAEVLSQRLIPHRTRSGVRLEVILTDGVRQMNATFFAANEYKLIPHQKILTPGGQYLFAGKVGSYKGQLQLIHPEFEDIDTPKKLVETTNTPSEYPDENSTHHAENMEQIRQRTQRPIPIYAAKHGLTSWVIQRAITLISEEINDTTIPDIIPEHVREKYGLVSRATAIRDLHQPANDETVKQARHSLAWIEAFTLHIALLSMREATRNASAPQSPKENNALVNKLLDCLPFALTDAQKEALNTLSCELESSKPSQRLLQADVGAGKTVVALAALTQVVGAGHQGALLAPTEVLAQQHYASLQRLTEPMQGAPETAFPLYLLTATTPPAQRRHILTEINNGQPSIVIGTHALLNEDVKFADLALVVIDEQHRFGVSQRDRLRQASRSGIPHQIVMTATPIPRTIAMTVFADLEQTHMKGLPAGRHPVSTYLVDAEKKLWFERIWQRAREEITSGGRVYVVCPRIDCEDTEEDPENNTADLRDDLNEKRMVFPQEHAGKGERTRQEVASVEGISAYLGKIPALQGIAIATLTGRNTTEEKTRVMSDFASGKMPLLVATTVIEVGVDVPEATMMVIMDAQQFGLSQLHQLRGRVGRSSKPSVCMAVHRHGIADVSLRRLEAFAATQDGFQLAEADLALRREGDVIGAEQSGRSSGLQFLSVIRDGIIIEKAREAALILIEDDPALQKYPLLRQELRARDSEEIMWMERS
ncbi:ATP-dependent DNA helicase RecG [Schaalia sp. lx-100]|uniref:ATP-dependent DNA helicase RecG n=1 Tax=Schaalia sp. lx-100 TaxID=2899081 RepID=UPI001E5CB6B0|nr:ATP-dependent DNA helicase RecG [Schaalia sp. lx-100]MCD4556888.1 ATP-dependent DNA helicase RecG [Schaalia sp. lx-100]